MSDREELRAKLAAAKADREAREKARAEELEVTQMRRELEREEAIAKAEADGKVLGRDFLVVDTDLGPVLVGRAHPAAFKKFQDNEITSRAAEELTYPCLLHPKADAFDRMIDLQPAIPGRCANAIATLAGVRAGELAKK